MPSLKAFALVSLGLFAVAPSCALADPGTPNPVYRSFESGKTAHDAGVIRGVIADVDYSGGMLMIKSHGHELVAVAVVPSTAIYQGKQYETFSDLHRGQSVEISAYEVDGRLVAQTIRLK
ncbi:MAG: hypothetical protein ABI282_11370 [Candidatus Baltobacteraceae bacterium]